MNYNTFGNRIVGAAEMAQTKAAQYAGNTLQQKTNLHDQLDMLSKTIEELTERTHVLLDRLSYVTRPEATDATGEATERPLLSPVSARVAQNRDTLERQIYAINLLLERLDV